MMLRVSFQDNDYREAVREACINFIYAVANGYIDSKTVTKNYIEARDLFGIENIRTSIIKGIYAQLVAQEACRLYVNQTLCLCDEQRECLEYLSNIVTLEEVEEFNPCDENYETCYVDFNEVDVYLK